MKTGQLTTYILLIGIFVWMILAACYCATFIHLKIKPSHLRIVEHLVGRSWLYIALSAVLILLTKGILLKLFAFHFKYVLADRLSAAIAFCALMTILVFVPTIFLQRTVQYQIDTRFSIKKSGKWETVDIAAVQRSQLGNIRRQLAFLLACWLVLIVSPFADWSSNNNTYGKANVSQSRNHEDSS